MQANRIQVEVVEIAGLGSAERAAWCALRGANPALASPYFDLRFIEVAGQVAPGAKLAVVREDGAICGLLPFQQRGALMQPLAAPLSDFHGVIGAKLPVSHLLPRLPRVRRARFGGLIGASGDDLAGLSARRAMAADLSLGFEAYLASRDSRFLKDKRRRRRALERDHGPLSFSLQPATRDDVAMIIEQKRAQIARTHQYDVFACGWTIALLERLVDAAAVDFGLRTATLRAGGRVVAAELGLLSGARYHLWFPIYDPAFARYSPGALMTLDTLEALAAEGVSRVDFGVDADSYNREFADPAETVFEGLIERRRGPRGRSMRVMGAARLARRFDRIVACEPGLVGQIRGGGGFLTTLARRYPRLGAALGLGFGLVSLAMMVD